MNPFKQESEIEGKYDVRDVKDQRSSKSRSLVDDH
jgi:hypothetical protein